MSELDTLCINTLRFLSVDAVERAKSGHPGLPLGAAPMAYVLWSEFLRHNPVDPTWANRDRFLLSAGHGSALLYSLLYMTGYDLSLEDLQRFRQVGSRTPGHPEYGHTPGVEATTGPLGQGFAMGVGMAIAERRLATQFNREGFPVVDHHTYGIVSDGDLMEGIASEAASLAGRLRLGKLIYLYDDNHVSLEGGTQLSFTENVIERFRAYGWSTRQVSDGNDTGAIAEAIARARSEGSGPTLIAIRTHIGYGSPRQDTKDAHGEPLGVEGTRLTKQKLGWPVESSFLVPEPALKHMREARERGANLQKEWNDLLEAYRSAHPDLASEFDRVLQGRRPPRWSDALPRFPVDSPPLATREASEKVLNALAPVLPELMGGSADLAPSTKTLIRDAGSFLEAEPVGRNLHFGVRENAMAAAVNGMALHGGTLPYGATFLVFSDYARPSLRLAALMQAHSLFIFTHDSIWVGEDGPTHQPIEHLSSLRAMPGMTVIRPADANEVAAAWRVAIDRSGPVSFILTRQKLPVLKEVDERAGEGLARGAYVVSEAEGTSLQLVLIATGSELGLALEAKRTLGTQGKGVRVVSMPSWELFEEQDASYRTAVLPPNVPRVSVEAGATFGWSRYVGTSGVSIGIDRFGLSGPGADVAKSVGLTLERLVDSIRSLLPAP